MAVNYSNTAAIYWNSKKRYHKNDKDVIKQVVSNIEIGESLNRNNSKKISHSLRLRSTVAANSPRQWQYNDIETDFGVK